MLIFLDFTGFSGSPIFCSFTIFSVYLGIKSHIFCFKSCKKVVKGGKMSPFFQLYNFLQLSGYIPFSSLPAHLQSQHAYTHSMLPLYRYAP